MATPIVEQIAAQIAGRLALIRVANGYQVNATVCRPTRLDTVARTHGLIVMHQGDDRPADPEFKSGYGVLAWRQEFLFDLYVMTADYDADQIDGDMTAAETLANTFRADVIKCLMADATCGGLAIDTEIDASVRWPEMADSPYWAGLTVAASVTYRTKDTDPYAAP